MRTLIRKLKNKRTLINFLAIVIAVECLIYFSPLQPGKITLEQYADEVISTCKDAGYRPTCYDKTIPQLMDYISMEDAFKVTSIIQNKDKEYAYCHVLAHALAAREVDKDPSKWKDVATRSPSGICSNGGIHGAFQERFRGEFFSDAELEKIKPELNDLCEKRENWNPTGLEQGSCYHAMGHLTMYLTEADIHRALNLCDELALKPEGRDYRHLCYDGAFMQIFQPLEPEDFSLIKGKEVTKETHEKFCSQFTGEEKGSCWSEGWPLYRKELEKPQTLTQYCDKASSSEKERCFSSIMYVLTAMFNLDNAKIMAYCPGLRGDEVGKCFASSASRMIEVDYRNIQKSVDLCSAAEKYDPKHFCFDMLLKFSSYNYKEGSPEFYEVCNTLPGDWKNKCLSKK